MLSLLSSHSSVTAKAASEFLECNRQHAHTILKRLHKEGVVYLSGWVDVSDRARIATYSLGQGEDVPKPRAKTPSERAKKYATTEKGKACKRRSNATYKANPKNKPKVLKYQRDYYKKNADSRRARQRAYYSRKLLEDKGIAAIDPLLYALCRPSSGGSNLGWL